jgi:hypothetical protein
MTLHDGGAKSKKKQTERQNPQFMTHDVDLEEAKRWQEF